MIERTKRWNLELEICEDFSISIKDAYSCIISGDFDEDDIAYKITELFDPEYLYVNGELDEWAKNNGYVLAEED